jgi:hypothetical protein
MLYYLLQTSHHGTDTDEALDLDSFISSHAIVYYLIYLLIISHVRA